MHFLSFVPLLLIFMTDSVLSKFFNELGSRRNLIVLSAPSVWDDNYHSTFKDLIRFQIGLAKTIQGHDNVVVLADRHTMPFLDGRTHSIRERLPFDVLMEADLYDINLRDFAPFGIRQLVKFTYMPTKLDPMAAKQIDASMRRFLKLYKLPIDKGEPKLILSGDDVVDNGINKAIINQKVLVDNKGRLPDWAIMIKLFNAFKKVVIIDNPLNTTVGMTKRSVRLDDVLAFIDEHVLVVPSLPHEAREYLDAELHKKFRDEVMLIELPTNHSSDSNDMENAGICGLYTALLATDRFIYMPTFGNDPANWEHGHSTMLDKMTVHLLEVNTRKKVVPVNVPRSICRQGIGLRGLTWGLKGKIAELLVQRARRQGRRRYSKH